MVRTTAISAALLFCALHAGVLAGASFTANNVTELRSHITTSNGNSGSDTITVAAGTFLLSGAALENFNGSGDLDITRSGGTLTIEGAGISDTYIDGGNADRVFHINAGSGVTVIFRNLTIQAGVTNDNGVSNSEATGAGILNQSGANLTLESVSVILCTVSGDDGTVGTTGAGGNPPGDGGIGSTGAAARGGAIFHAGGSLNMDNCLISSISATSGFGGPGGSGGVNTGAGAGGTGGDGNTGGSVEGGGLYISGGSATITRTTIDSIVAQAGDGGNGGTGGPGPTVGQYGNGGVGGAAQGGAIYVAGGSLTLEGSTLSNNETIGGDGGDGFTGGAGGLSAGGDVYVSAGTVNFRNTTFSDGTVRARNGGDASGGGSGATGGAAFGGSVCIVGGTPTFYNCTVASGSTIPGAGGSGSSQGSGGLSQGGNVFHGAGTVTAHSTIFWGGGSTQGADFFGFLTASACLFGSTAGATIVPGAVANKLNQNPGLGNLANNGGAVLTRMISNGGPAFNAGSNPLNFVQDGRGLWYNRSHGQTDIGAVEIQSGFPRPIVEDPASAFSMAGTSYTITGIAVPNTLVRIYADTDNDTIIDPGESVVGTQQLTGGNYQFSIMVSLSAGSANNFMATADNTALESEPSDVPTITETSTPPNSPVVTTPATTTSTAGSSYNIIGTADPDSLVQIYVDYNNNGAIDAVDTVVASQQLTGGASNWNISTPLMLSIANNFIVTAKDATGFESVPTNVPTITETSIPLVAKPVVTDPALAQTIDAADYAIVGTAPANSLVKVYRDSNNDGFVNGADAALAQQQLSGGAVDFSITVILNQDANNDFLVTATDGSMNESLTTDVPTITEQTPGGGGGGGSGGDGGGGCSSGSSGLPWLLFGAVALLAARRRRQWNA